MACRGVRGATTVGENGAEEILQATRELLLAMAEANGIDPADLVSVWFTLTADLDAVFPAKAARQLGWAHVPLMDAVEVPVPGSLARCVRVLMHWNTPKKQDQIQHVYLKDAKSLRPDLCQ